MATTTAEPGQTNAGLTDELMQRLLVLSEADRATVAERMLESLGIRDDVEPLSETWRNEIARRLEKYTSGKSITYSPEEVFAHLRERTRQRKHS